MPRASRITVPGVYHHVTQRGNNRQHVFFVDEDRLMYLQFLKQEAETYGLRVYGYCLMTNHIHLIAIPESETALASAVGRTHFKYTRYINDMHSRSGHLWQNRFYSCPLDEEWYLPAMRYVEMNPVRAGMVRVAWRWPWSSAAAHAGKSDDKTGLLQMPEWRAMRDAPGWADDLKPEEHEQITGLVRTRTSTGRPLGSDSFMSKLEVAAGRRLRPLPAGRPKKEKVKS